MDEEFQECRCGRNREIATTAQSFVSDYPNPAKAYRQALYRTIEKQPEWTEDCSFWDCVADYISLNYDIEEGDE